MWKGGPGGGGGGGGSMLAFGAEYELDSARVGGPSHRTLALGALGEHGALTCACNGQVVRGAGAFRS